MSKELIIDIENPKDNDLISRQAVKEVFPKWKFISYEAYLCSVLEIDKLPSVSTEKTGHWIKGEEWCETVGGFERWGNDYTCSECGLSLGRYTLTDYCPNCGAKMVEPKEKNKEWVNFAEDLIPIIDEAEREK